jgi:hypothetical protein
MVQAGEAPGSDPQPLIRMMLAANMAFAREPSGDDMAADPMRLSSPQRYLVRMVVFLILVGFVGFILYRQIWTAFLNNPGLNGVIGGVLLIGIVLALRQVIRLFSDVRWINQARRAEGDLALAHPPALLAPMASLLGGDLGRSGLSMATMRSVLDSIGARLDEHREIVRYIAGLLVFLGLLGTFWGLLETVSSVGDVIRSMRTGADAGVLFEDLKSGLAAPLGGMGISFSSSLFGLSGSLIVGFLDLQAGQAQSRFYTELEDWLATIVAGAGPSLDEDREGALAAALDRLNTALDAQGGRATGHAMANLAEGIQGLVQHMRSEQQMIRDWVEAQAAQQKEVKRLLERLAGEREEQKRLPTASAPNVRTPREEVE